MNKINAIILSALLATGGIQAADTVANDWDSLPRLEADAKKGNVYALAKLGTTYLKGTLVSQDVAKGIQLITQSADGGLREAQELLGKAYAQGLFDLKEDDREAAKWFRMAAEQGSASAAMRTSELYFDGKGTPLDAYFWALIAEKLGYADPAIANATAANREVYGRKLSAAQRRKLEAEAIAWQPRVTLAK